MPFFFSKKGLLVQTECNVVNIHDYSYWKTVRRKYSDLNIILFIIIYCYVFDRISACYRMVTAIFGGGFLNVS